MSELHPLGAAKTIVNLSNDLMKVAKENPDAQEAGQYAAKTLKIVSQTVHNVLLPLAAANFAIASFETYIKGKFGDDLSGLTSQIPPEYLVSPKPSVAGPAIQSLAFTHDEPELSEMFLNLIATSMDGRVQSKSHPAFVEVVKQLDGNEARCVKSLLSTGGTIALCEVRSAESGWIALERNVIDLKVPSGAPAVSPEFAVWVDNWVRLGLFESSFTNHLDAPGAYDWLEGRPEYLRHTGLNLSPTFAKGLLERTSFGTQFAVAVGLKLPI